jgi:translation initiation factor eIF-2B subunit gamma
VLIRKLDITIITPPSSEKAIETALLQNPHLTSLPIPRADILAPETLDQTSVTAEILRNSQVRAIIKGDFVVLPCDLVCELAGESLLEAWMVKQAGLGGVATSLGGELDSNYGGERSGRRGGLGVYFETKGEGSTKREETDFIITAPLQNSKEPTAEGSLMPHINELVYSTTKDTLKDIVEEKKTFPIRQSIAKKHPRTKIFTTYRDAHVYLFPYWILDLVKNNMALESISEDVIGWWAKAGWQKGLGTKLGLDDILQPKTDSLSPQEGEIVERSINLANMSTTWTVKGSEENDLSASKGLPSLPSESKMVPPFLAYLHPRNSEAPLIRRVDTSALLLYVSLRLAKLNSVEEVGKSAASPYAHASKIAYPAGVAERTTISKADCLLADNITVESKSIIKESVVGANCHIKSGAKLTRCLLMDGAVVGERCELTGCIVGRRAHVGSHSVLIDCEIQDGNVIPEETDAKNEKFMVFAGLDADAGGDEELEFMAEDTLES